MAVEFFIEISPGAELQEKIKETKDAVRAHLGERLVDDPTRTMFLRDPPHFTLQVGRTGQFSNVVNAYAEVARRFKTIDYDIDGVERANKGGLIEVHATVNPASERCFRDLHYALIEASRPWLTREPPTMFGTQQYTGYEAENLTYCHFPPGRGNYRAHASVGRFSEELLSDGRLLGLLTEFKPQGQYRSGGLIVWQYVENDPKFRVCNPLFIELNN